MITTHLQDEKGRTIVKVGDLVECKDARFFVGSINDSQSLCILDKSKPWELLNENSSMAACIKQGNYAASLSVLTVLDKPTEQEQAHK